MCKNQSSYNNLLSLNGVNNISIQTQPMIAASTQNMLGKYTCSSIVWKNTLKIISTFVQVVRSLQHPDTRYAVQHKKMGCAQHHVYIDGKNKVAIFHAYVAPNPNGIKPTVEVPSTQGKAHSRFKENSFNNFRDASN